MSTAASPAVDAARRFTEGLSWLHARVGRRLPVQLSRANDHRTNARVRVAPSATSLQPTVYLRPGAALAR